ncbi:hypothetical protein MXD59_07605 [Frankia sp. Ag45/Mut15]|uniref:Uncharacterized protein n=1 Tax=Frankia umida TaxID=573489 RepID=A0ABT0JVS4_9ACTN|nr:hypothetical protein [Frankia umida]MCK9875636.1 hypothetical protein [Frankia umida]
MTYAILALLTALIVAGIRFGTDSRDGRDWTPAATPTPTPTATATATGTGTGTGTGTTVATRPIREIRPSPRGRQGVGVRSSPR